MTTLEASNGISVPELQACFWKKSTLKLLAGVAVRPGPFGAFTFVDCKSRGEAVHHGVYVYVGSTRDIKSSRSRSVYLDAMQK